MTTTFTIPVAELGPGTHIFNLRLRQPLPEREMRPRDRRLNGKARIRARRSA